MPPRQTASPLQRGTACLCCRKRKLKCDGTRPVCRQCTKMNRSSECEYDDKKQKSRTQKLKEKLAMLEKRLKELDTEIGVPGVPSTSSSPLVNIAQNFAPGVPVSPSQNDVPIIKIPSLVAVKQFIAVSDEKAHFNISPWPKISSTSYSSPYLPLAQNDVPISRTRRSSNEGNIVSDYPQSLCSFPSVNPPFTSPIERGEVSEETKKLLLEIFLNHRHQCYFDGNLSRFQPSSLNPPHPALMNAIYLLACYFARSPHYSRLEDVFFVRARGEIDTAMEQSDRLVDVVQASCLLAVYLYASGRIIEGYTQSFSASRLGVGLGLHQLRSPSGTNLDQFDNELSHIPLPPPVDLAELRDRMSVFWQVFTVDRCWSVANGLPLGLPEQAGAKVVIKTPWLNATAGQDKIAHLSTTLSFYEPSFGITPRSVFVPALRAQAASLYERTCRLSSRTKEHSYWDEYRTVELTLQRFSASLPPFIGFEAWRNQLPTVDVDLFAVHTMVQVASIQLQQTTLVEAIFQAVHSVVMLIRQLHNVDYEYIDAFLSTCWFTVAKTCLRILRVSIKNPIQPPAIVQLKQDLEVVIFAIKTLSTFFPLAGDHMKKIEQEYSQ